MQQSPSQDESKAIQTPNDEVKIDLSVPDEQMLLKSTFYYPFCRCDEEAGPLKRIKLSLIRAEVQPPELTMLSF